MSARVAASLTVRNVTFVNPGSAVPSPRDLYVSEGLIRSTRPDVKVDAIVDGAGLFAIPGLIDMHVHATSDPHSITASSWADLNDTTMTISAVHNLAAAIRAGVTSVRDLGAPRDLGYRVRAAWQRGLFVGARPFVAGPVITATGGHGNWLGVESNGVAEIASLVRKNVAAGSDVIKLMMRSAARKMELRPAELAEAIQEAHWTGTPVAVHANFADRSIDAAVEAGCDSLEHGYALSSDTAATMAAQGTALCPTISALTSIVSNPDAWVRRGGRELVETAKAHYVQARQSFEYAIDAGVRVIAGTDAGVTGVPFDLIATELAVMSEWGASNEQVLFAATSNAADVLGFPELGTLAVETPADAVLLDTNPLTDVTAYRRVVGVIQGGRLVVLNDRDRLISGTVGSSPGNLIPELSRSGSSD